MQVLCFASGLSTRGRSPKHKPHCVAHCVVANTLNAFRGGTVGFIDWLGVVGCRAGTVWSQPCAARKVTKLPPPADSYDYRSSEPKAKCGG